VDKEMNLGLKEARKGAYLETKNKDSTTKLNAGISNSKSNETIPTITNSPCDLYLYIFCAPRGCLS
jgi:hypothetical protein|tara:strand:+ start:807 stop:1004 length:198 start_codon:yes stop_codon:yes gene_type:complete